MHCFYLKALFYPKDHFTEIVLSFQSTQFQYYIMECLAMLEFQGQPVIEGCSKHSLPENEAQVPDLTTQMVAFVVVGFSPGSKRLL